jgi:hypothetical protein
MWLMIVHSIRISSLIVAFLAFQTADFFNSYFLAFAGFQFVVVALVLFVIIVVLNFTSVSRWQLMHQPIPRVEYW